MASTSVVWEKRGLTPRRGSGFTVLPYYGRMSDSNFVLQSGVVLHASLLHYHYVFSRVVYCSWLSLVECCVVLDKMQALKSNTACNAILRVLDKTSNRPMTRLQASRSPCTSRSAAPRRRQASTQWHFASSDEELCLDPRNVRSPGRSSRRFC